jgi:hypothetical protein
MVHDLTAYSCILTIGRIRLANLEGWPISGRITTQLIKISPFHRFRRGNPYKNTGVGFMGIW